MASHSNVLQVGDKENKVPAIKTPKKLIEVALPLDAINKAAAREKSIRHGHPHRHCICGGRGARWRRHER